MSMAELQTINKILLTRSLSVLNQNNIDSDYFLTYRDEIDYILDHYTEHGNVPDKETFLSESRFKEHDFFEVSESDKYLVETLQEQYMYKHLVPFVHTLADKVTDNSEEAVEFLMAQVEQIKSLASQYKEGYDIVKGGQDRKSEYDFRNESKGLLGITTGIAELDDITHGWLKEDFIVIAGRTNEGKTWVLLFFLVSAWLAGVPVLLYSGEMSETIVGFRFDTLHGKFSGTGLMKGSDELGESKTKDDYYDYLENLSSTDVPFVVITPKHIGGKRLTIPKLHQLIEKYNPGIVGIDQLSLMDDYRAERGEQTRIRYTHIAEDLFLTSEKYEIPILTPAQANRDSSKKSANKSNEEAPELEHLAESDGIGQNATRVLTIKSIGPTMKFSLKKNRYGERFSEIMMIWDLDKGIVKPFLTAQTDNKGQIKESNPVEQEGVDLF